MLFNNSGQKRKSYVNNPTYWQDLFYSGWVQSGLETQIGTFNFYLAQALFFPLIAYMELDQPAFSGKNIYIKKHRNNWKILMNWKHIQTQQSHGPKADCYVISESMKTPKLRPELCKSQLYV